MNSAWGAAPAACVLVLLSRGIAAFGGDGVHPEEKAPAKKAQGVVKPARVKPPERAALPAAGERSAEDLLSLAGVLSGRVVRIESDRVRETKVTITEEAAGNEVTFDELKVLLAAHRLYLFPVTDPGEGDILVATRNPRWKEEPPRHTKVIEVGEGSFEAAWAKIRKAVEERNAALPKGEPPIIAVPDDRTGKIILGASSGEALDAIATLIGEKKEKDPNRPHFYAYTGRYRPVADLQKEILEKLNDGERNRLRVVISSRGNRLLFRAPADLWEKVEAKLKELDSKKN